MNSAEAHSILIAEVSKYRSKNYKELRALLTCQDCYEINGASGNLYQIEIQSMRDDEHKGVLRVIAAIDDRALRAFAPMVEDFLITPDGRFVGE